MRIDYTRLSKFLSNPERYRLSQCWNLSPKVPKTGMARMFKRGMFRGLALHELLDEGIKDISVYTPEEVQDAQEMADLFRRTYPDEKPLAKEIDFEYPIPDSPHTLVGRIDHIITREGPVVGDIKSCGTCTKKELQQRIEAYLGNWQSRCYLLGSRSLGYDIRSFLFRIVQRKEIHERWVAYSSLDLNKFARQIHQVCCMIEFMQSEFGIEQPWPSLKEKYHTGFETIAGIRMYAGYIPDGFEPRTEHLSILTESEVSDL